MKRTSIVRIQQIELRNFKNVEHGIVTMPAFLNKEYFLNSSDILGIYGQNGTGKTAIVEAMEIIKSLLSGNPLPVEATDYISKNHDFCTISVLFTVDNGAAQSQVEYSVNIKHNTTQLNVRNDSINFEMRTNSTEKNQCIIDSEKIRFSLWDGSKFGTLKEYMTFSSEKVGQFTPSSRYKRFIRIIDKNLETSSQTNSNILEGKIQIATNALIAQKERRSAIFSRTGQDFIKQTGDDILAPVDDNTKDASLYDLHALTSIMSLNIYARTDLSVISNIHSGMINTKETLPLTIVYGELNRQHHINLSLRETFVLRPLASDIVKKAFEIINIVIPKIIPNLSLEIKELGTEILQDGTEGIRIQLLSRRGDVLLPLGYESSGIIKIISIVNALVCVYRNPSSCLIVDELDAGIFEYLLGELLSVFKKNAQGQIIFTSHNLRPLELLDKSSIMFSTANPQNRYARVKHLKKNNNLRDVYFRRIQLGGEQEELYMETDSIEIARAFRKASKVENNGSI